MRTIMIVYAFMLGFASLGSVSAENNKVDICHFEEAKNSWKLISLPQLSAAAHLENHDDAIPSGTTPQTGTMLGAGCEVICPCEGIQHGAVHWDDTFMSSLCGDRPNSVFVGNGNRDFLISRTVDEPCCFCVIETPTAPIVLFVRINELEEDACRESIRQIAANDGVNCPEF